jgi:ferredoxin-NADP reductase
MNYFGAIIRLFILPAVLISAASPVSAQATPDEHSGHHPQEQTLPMPATNANSNPNTNAAPTSNANTSGSGMTNGTDGGMGEMMKEMGNPPPKEVYPSLISLPDLTPEKRAEIERLAQERIATSKEQMAAATTRLTEATMHDDFAAMQEAASQLRTAAAQFESGLAAQRALAEGQPPSNVALRWFQQDMNLLPPTRPGMQGAILGVTPLHLFTMVLLIGFAISMVAMYFFKMRRAAALFGRLDPIAGSPPPGSSPALAGGTAASSPPTSSTGPHADSQTDSALPVTANWHGQLRVTNIITETPSVKTFRLVPLSGDGLLPFTFVPGQFLNVAFAIGGARMNRSYSISSSPTKRKYVELTVRREPRGAVSRHIDDLLKVGDEIEAGGPVGKFTFDGTEADSVVLISGGVGITPMMSIARFLTDRSWMGDIFFITTCRDEEDLIFAKEIVKLERRNPKLHVTVTISGNAGIDWRGFRGRINKELLTQTVPDLISRRIHLCGPPPMMDAVKAILAEIGVPQEQIKTELFGATKPTPGAPGTTAKQSAPATGPLVMFSQNNKSAKIHVDQTVLELSEELGIGIEFSCRVGTCGLCKVKMTSGEVEMAVEDALDAGDKANGIILACQAKPTSDITVEA